MAEGPSEPRDPQPGDRFGVFTIDGMLGEGGMSRVYRARPVVGQRPVALKVAKASARATDVEARRFSRESRVAAEVSHPNLAPVIDCGEVDGRMYIAMPLMEGGSLADRIRDRGVVPLEEIVRIVREVGGALDALHRGGVVHRDVKPSNVLLDGNGTAMLCDLGLVHVDGYSVLTEIGHVLGTMDYMAPEMISGGEVGPPVDIYALGCVAYEMLAGRVPFTGGSMFEVAFGHLAGTPSDPVAGRTDIPAEVSEVVQFALAKEPDRRPPTATMFARLLGVAAQSSAPA